MSDQLEIELKFEILDKTGFLNFIKNLEQTSDKTVTDTYFDTSDCQLFQRGIFIRVRNHKRLDFKFNPTVLQNPNTYDDHSSSDEYNFDLPMKANDLSRLNSVLKILNLKEINKPTIEELKKQNNFQDSINLNKVRREYKLDKFTLVFDSIDELGEILEIEYIGKGEEIEEIKKEMLDILKPLSLKLLTVGNNELYWRKNNFDLYLKGRFLLQEDYAKYRPEVLKSKQD